MERAQTKYIVQLENIVHCYVPYHLQSIKKIQLQNQEQVGEEKACEFTLRQRWRGSHKYSVILSTRMHPIVRTAKARIKGFGSCESCKIQHVINKISEETCQGSQKTNSKLLRRNIYMIRWYYVSANQIVLNCTLNMIRKCK